MKERMEDYYSMPKKKNIEWKKIAKELLEWVLCFIIAYVIYLFINYFVGTISGVKQVSMFPTARENERLLIQRPTIFERKIERGDIITFEAPKDIGYYEEIDATDVVAEYEELNFVESFFYDFIGIGKMSYIKRVIGVAGDHIVITEQGEVFVNDEKINEPYLHEQFTPITGEYTDVVVPVGCIYVMGDNRKESKDSRFFGCIPVSHVDGYVVARIWPLNKLGKLE